MKAGSSNVFNSHMTLGKLLRLSKSLYLLSYKMGIIMGLRKGCCGDLMKYSVLWQSCRWRVVLDRGQPSLSTARECLAENSNPQQILVEWVNEVYTLGLSCLKQLFHSFDPPSPSCYQAQHILFCHYSLIIYGIVTLICISASPCRELLLFLN